MTLQHQQCIFATFSGDIVSLSRTPYGEFFTMNNSGIESLFGAPIGAVHTTNNNDIGNKFGAPHGAVYTNNSGIGFEFLGVFDPAPALSIIDIVADIKINGAPAPNAIKFNHGIGFEKERQIEKKYLNMVRS